MAVKIDIIDGNRGRKTYQGWELERIAVVTGLTGTPHKKLIDAANTSGVPSIGDGHPSLSTCKLREIIPESVGKDEVKLRLIYSQYVTSTSQWQPTFDTIECGASIGQVETNKDIDDNVMWVQYTYPADYTKNLDYASKTHKQGGTIIRLVPESSISIVKQELFPPAEKARAFVGKVNATGWIIDPNAPARTWLCSGIVGRSTDGGVTYFVTYTFQYRPDTWDATILFTDPNDGKPPDDLVAGTGSKVYQIYEETNFNYLNLV